MSTKGTKVRNKVLCNCKECKGKYVDERTRKRHEDLENHLATSVSRFVPSLPFPANTALKINLDPITEGSSRKISSAEQEELNFFDDNYEHLFTDFERYAPQKKRRRQNQF